ncbi:MAG: hypothetical protein ACFNQH_01360 [Veillonella parvula]
MPSIPMTNIEDIATRKYFDTTMLDDALLRTYVTPDIVEESTKYVESVAQSMGIDKKDIASPTPYLVSRLALTYAYMTTAQRKALFTKGGATAGSHNLVADNDSYALKYKMYREALNDLLKQITELTFTNGKPAKRRRFPFTQPIARN